MAPPNTPLLSFPDYHPPPYPTRAPPGLTTQAGSLSSQLAIFGNIGNSRDLATISIGHGGKSMVGPSWLSNLKCPQILDSARQGPSKSERKDWPRQRTNVHYATVHPASTYQHHRRLSPKTQAPTPDPQMPADPRRRTELGTRR